MSEELFKWKTVNYVQRTCDFWEFEQEQYDDELENFSSYKTLHEETGLIFKVGFELSGADYSFNLVYIFKKDNGYYLATDSGCSCPMPLENYSDINDFTGPLSLEDAVEEVTNLLKSNSEDQHEYVVEDFNYNMREFLFNEMITKD